jgi:hypothetical protein
VSLAHLAWSGKRLPAHPQPLPDDLFTHWFMRVAHENGLKAQTFADRLFGARNGFWSRDQDKLSSPDVVARVADAVGKTPEQIQALTLGAYEGLLYLKHNPYGNTRWILPLGVYHRTRRRRGLQYCPECLTEDRTQYFRRQWRLAYATICEKHSCLLHEACYQCGAPVAFHRTELGHRTRHEFDSIACCHACSTELWRAPVIAPHIGNWQAFTNFRAMLMFHDMGWLFCGEHSFHYGHLYLDVLYRVCGALSSARTSRLFDIASRESGMPERRLEPNLEFECRPLAERHHLLLVATWLLLEWPERFVHCCRRADIKGSRLYTREKLPYWFESAVGEYLNGSVYSPTAEEVEAVVKILAASGTGVSTGKIRALSGWSDVEPVLAYRQPRLHRMSDKEAERFFGVVEQSIHTAAPGSQVQLERLRDRLVYRRLRCCDWSIDRVRQLRLADRDELLNNAAAGGHCAELGDELRDYLGSVRLLLVSPHQSEVLFSARGGKEMSREGIRRRFLKILENTSIGRCRL